MTKQEHLNWTRVLVFAVICAVFAIAVIGASYLYATAINHSLPH
jgi:hypothetical protein